MLYYKLAKYLLCFTYAVSGSSVRTAVDFPNRSRLVKTEKVIAGKALKFVEFVGIKRDLIMSRWVRKFLTREI